MPNAKDDIDFDILGDLTDQDFDRLGVSVGHRRRMLKAIRERGALLRPRRKWIPLAQRPRKSVQSAARSR
jgi:hypothetical protein